MKYLELRVTEINTKAAKFLYEVVENGTVLCSRKSSREYVACYVSTGMLIRTNLPKYWADYFFGRVGLIGQGDSKRANPDTAYYALAVAPASGISYNL